MPRGGKRQGRPGASYKNRADLQLGPRKPLPVQAGPSQGYGQRVALERQQQALPMGPPPAAIPPGGGAAPVDRVPFNQYARERGGDLFAATTRPDEPWTSGLPSGEGPGVEALGVLARPDAGDPDAIDMARYLPALEAMANQPGASVSTRNFVRRLRGTVSSDGAI